MQRTEPIAANQSIETNQSIAANQSVFSRSDQMYLESDQLLLESISAHHSYFFHELLTKL